MKHRKGDPPYIYLFIYAKLKEDIGETSFVSAPRIFEVMKRVTRVPRYLYYPMLCQMEEYKLIRRINRQKYRILYTNYEKQINKLKKLSFWEF